MCSTLISLTAPHFFSSFPPSSPCERVQPVTWTPLNGESAPSWISCPRDFRKHRSHTWSYFRKSFYFKEEGGVLLFAAHQLLSGLWLYDGSRCSQTVEKPVRSTLQPGIMNPGSRSLKFVILTALQALCVSLWLCGGVLSTSAEGKTWGWQIYFAFPAKIKDACAKVLNVLFSWLFPLVTLKKKLLFASFIWRLS